MNAQRMLGQMTVEILRRGLGCCAVFNIVAYLALRAVAWGEMGK
jgi:hypothetical protein